MLNRETLKQTLIKIRLDEARNNMNLAMTKIFLEVWKGLLESENDDRVDEIEQRIRERAEMEWGKNTKVSFDRENGKAEVRNKTRNLTFNFQS